MPKLMPMGSADQKITVPMGSAEQQIAWLLITGSRPALTPGRG